MSLPPNEPGYFTHLLNFNPQQYSSSPNQSNPSPPGSQNSNSSSQPYPPFGTQMSPEQAYQSQLAYHQQQQYGFQNFSNPRNTQPQFFPQQSSQPQCFPQPSSQPQFKIPKPKDPRDARRRMKKRGKQHVVDLDEGDDDNMPEKRAITCWNGDEEILLAETWIEHSQDANIGKDQEDDVYWNMIMQDFNSRTSPRTKNMITGKWLRMHCDYQRFNAIYKHLTRKSRESDADLIENAKTSYIERGGRKFQYDHVWIILKNYPKWNAAEPIDEDNLEELFGPDPRERPAGKQRAPKKQKSVDTSSAGGSTGGSTGGSQPESVSSLVSQDYRRKCDAAERAYETKREKELAMMQCRELRAGVSHARSFDYLSAEYWALLSRRAMLHMFYVPKADIRRADYIAKQRAMDDALMALEFIKDVHDMMISKMYKLKNGALSSDDMAGQITLEKNGKVLDFFPGEVSTDRITAIQEAYQDMASALTEADGIDYSDPEELELLVATLMDLDAMDGKGSVSLLAECSSSPDVNTRKALANALSVAPSMWTLGNAGMGALQRLAEDSNPTIAAAASKTISELKRQWEIEEGDNYRFMMNQIPLRDVDYKIPDDNDETED
nr:senescence-associated protein AAF, chlorolplastic isoform X5 [Tanacetum cinerariifolium]